MEMSVRLKAARKDAGYKSATAAAEALGVAASTYRAHENGQNQFNVEEAKQYARRYKVSATWLLFGGGMTQTSTPNLPTDTHEGFNPSVGTVSVIGEISAGTWLDIEEVEEREAYQMSTVPASADYPTDRQYAFEVKGTSINRVAAEGDRLICLDLGKSGLTLNSIQNDDLVIVEQTKHSGQMIRRTAKRLRRTSQGYDLWPDSDDPKHAEPIPVNGSENGETIRVMAKVLWVLRKP